MTTGRLNQINGNKRVCQCQGSGRLHLLRRPVRHWHYVSMKAKPHVGSGPLALILNIWVLSGPAAQTFVQCQVGDPLCIEILLPCRRHSGNCHGTHPTRAPLKGKYAASVALVLSRLSLCCTAKSQEQRAGEDTGPRGTSDLKREIKLCPAPPL